MVSLFISGKQRCQMKPLDPKPSHADCVRISCQVAEMLQGGSIVVADLYKTRDRLMLELGVTKAVKKKPAKAKDSEEGDEIDGQAIHKKPAKAEEGEKGNEIEPEEEDEEEEEAVVYKRPGSAKRDRAAFEQLPTVALPFMDQYDL